MHDEWRPVVRPREPPRDIVAAGLTDHDTYYECSSCGRTWLGRCLPGVIHRYVVCSRCDPREQIRD